MNVPTLMLVTDRLRAGQKLLHIIDSTVDAGVDVVQVREKDLDHTQLLSLTREVVQIIGDRAQVVVNSDVDVALKLGIGLHQPESSSRLTNHIAKRLRGGVLVGRSFHAEVRTDDVRLDYLLFGHIFKTVSKAGREPQGLRRLSELTKSTSTPVWAIGGINAENAASVVERGARGVAVIGAIIDAADPSAATQALRREIDRAAEGPRAGVGASR